MVLRHASRGSPVGHAYMRAHAQQARVGDYSGRGDDHKSHLETTVRDGDAAVRVENHLVVAAYISARLVGNDISNASVTANRGREANRHVAQVWKPERHAPAAR